MKTLTLIRHAKSAWDNPDISDQDRPLTGRGQRDARALARTLGHLGLRPDLFLASPARRCRQTVAAITQESTVISNSLQFEAALYEAEWDALLALIQSKGGTARNLWLCGHNPGLLDLLNRLGGIRLEKMPTSAFARLRFSVDAWDRVETTRGQLILLLTPKGMA